MTVHKRRSTKDALRQTNRTRLFSTMLSRVRCG